MRGVAWSKAANRGGSFAFGSERALKLGYALHVWRKSQNALRQCERKGVIQDSEPPLQVDSGSLNQICRSRAVWKPLVFTAIEAKAVDLACIVDIPHIAAFNANCFACW